MPRRSTSSSRVFAVFSIFAAGMSFVVGSSGANATGEAVVNKIDSLTGGNSPIWRGKDCRQNICPASCAQVCASSQSDDELRSCWESCIDTKRECARECDAEHQKDKKKNYCCENWSTGEPG